MSATESINFPIPIPEDNWQLGRQVSVGYHTDWFGDESLTTIIPGR